MNIPRPVLVREGILDSERVCRLGLAQQLFFRNLLHVCDGASRFDADADDLRFTLYRRSLDRVKTAHVRQWLEELHRAGLVELYTRSGKAYGKLLNYGQRDSMRKVLHPAPDDEPELPLADAEPPPRTAKPRTRKTPPAAPPAAPEEKEIEMKGRERAREAPPAPSPESFEAWTARLRAEWPGLDLDRELEQAIKRKEREGRPLERGWFETAWLPKATPTVARSDLAAARRAAAPVVTDDDEPAGWREVLTGTNYGTGGVFEVTTWREVKTNRDLLDFVTKQLQRKNAA